MNSQDPDHRELLSSFVDDELSPEERKEAMRLLAEDERAAEWLADIKSDAAEIADLPNYSLDSRFSERVMTAAAERQAEPARAVEPASPRRGVGRAIAYSLAVLAAALLIMWLGGNPDGPGDPGGPGADPPMAENDRSEPGVDDGSTEFVHQIPDGEYLMVVDLVLTERSRRDGLFEAALTQHGIRFDLDLKVEGELEQALLQSRFVQPAPAAANQAVAGDNEPQMVYVVGQAQQVSALIEFLQGKPDDFQQVLMDLAMSKTQLEVFQHLRRMADAQLASASPNPADIGASRRVRAQKLVFPFSFRVTRFSTLAMAGGLPALLDEAVKRTPPRGGDRSAGAPEGQQPREINLNNEGDVLTNVLFVLRK